MWIKTSEGLNVSAKDLMERSFKGLPPDSEPTYQELEKYFYGSVTH